MEESRHKLGLFRCLMHFVALTQTVDTIAIIVSSPLF